MYYFIKLTKYFMHLYYLLFWFCGIGKIYFNVYYIFN